MAMTLAKLLNGTLLISKIVFSNTEYSLKTKNVGYLKPCMPNLKKMDYITLQEKRKSWNAESNFSIFSLSRFDQNNSDYCRIHTFKHDFLSGNS